jgi:hypothetical protein
MRIAISIPDSLNESIEAFLKSTSLSRSEFFQRAARFYLDKVSALAVRENLDRVYGGREPTGEEAFRRAALPAPCKHAFLTGPRV